MGGNLLLKQDLLSYSEQIHSLFFFFFFSFSFLFVLLNCLNIPRGAPSTPTPNYLKPRSHYLGFFFLPFVFLASSSCQVWSEGRVLEQQLRRLRLESSGSLTSKEIIQARR